MQTNSEIAVYRAKLRERFPDLAQRYRIATLSLFGSRVRGEGRTDSDLDVLVQFDVTPSLLTWIKLQDELSDLLGLNVDLVLHDSLRPNVAEQVLATAVSV